MTNYVAKYQRALKRNLLCSRTVKKQLLRNFAPTLTAFIEENPAPSMDELCAAFGPPKEMAAVLMEGVSRNEVARYTRRKVVIRSTLGCVGALCLAYVLVTAILAYQHATQPPRNSGEFLYIDASAPVGASVNSEE